MAARGSKKKQAVSAFEVDKSVVAVSREDFVDILCDENNLLLSEFIEQLCLASDLQSQTRFIHALKGQVKQYIGGFDGSVSMHQGVSVAVRVLLRLYVRPSYFPLRGSFEWIVEIFSRACSIAVPSAAVMRRIVCAGCLNEWKSLVRSTTIADALTDKQMNELVGIVLSLNALAAFDSQVNWLDNAELSDPIQDPLLQFCQYLAKVYCHCVARICPDDASTGLTGAELLKYVECSGEGMRALVTVMKAKTRRPRDWTNSAAWLAVFGDLLSAAAKLLQSHHANKDVLTFTALCLVIIQRILSPGGASAQLSALVALLSVGPADSKLDEGAAVLHEHVRHAALCAPLMGQCALLRAALTVFDDDSLLTSAQPAAAAAAAAAEEVGIPQLLGPVFRYIMKVCEDAVPTNRLYGFQTLESWIARVLTVPGDVLFPPTICSVAFGLLQRNIGQACTVLTKAWSHPSRQVLVAFFVRYF